MLPSVRQYVKCVELPVAEYFGAGWKREACDQAVLSGLIPNRRSDCVLRSSQTINTTLQKLQVARTVWCADVSVRWSMGERRGCSGI